MSCISNNFSSFFLNSLNDPSEFAKYLSNGELKFSDFQVFGAGANAASNGPSAGIASQQTQYSTITTATPQSQPLNGSSAPFYNNNNNNNNGATNSAGTQQSPSNNAAVNGVAHHPHPHHQQHPHAQQQQQHLPMDTSRNYTHPAAPTTPQQHQLHHPPQQQHYMGSPQQQKLQGANFHHANNHLVTQHQTHHLPSNGNLPPQHNPQAPYSPIPPQQQLQQRWSTSPTSQHLAALQNANHHVGVASSAVANAASANTNVQHFDGSFEFLKYLRHSNEYPPSAGAAGAVTGDSSQNGSSSASSTAPNTPSNSLQHPQQQQNPQQQQQQAASLIDLDSSTSHKSRSSRKVAALLSSVSRASNSLDATTTLDVFDHDSKHTIFDLHHMTNGSNSNESSMEISNFAFPNSHLNASNSNTSSESATAGNSDFSTLNSSASSSAPKPLATFVIKDNFEAHASHKVEEGIFQHMNKLPSKKKENLKQLGVRFTGQMTLTDKSIVVENFIKFCHEYDIQDHRPFLSLNQSGLNKPEQIKFARYLGQGLPTFTLFCIYSNFKNLFCTKRTEIYTKDGYNLPYILDKTKRFLSNTTADLKNMIQQQSNDSIDFAASTNNNNNNNNTNHLAGSSDLSKCIIVPKVLENLVIYENFDVHETHRVEDGIFTHITRLPPKKQELFKQFGIQNNQTVTYYEKYIIIENFIKFCNEYKITDHRSFLDFHESGLPKCEQLKFVRYLGQGLPNLTLNKVFLAFKDILGLNRIEKITLDGYNLDTILKKKKKNIYNRMHATVHKDSTEAAQQAHQQLQPEQQQQDQEQQKLLKEQQHQLPLPTEQQQTQLPPPPQQQQYQAMHHPLMTS